MQALSYRQRRPYNSLERAGETLPATSAFIERSAKYARTAFNYEIVEKVAVLSQSGDTTKELNRVSYNGSPAKYDLRSWRRTDGEEKLLKGLTLTDEEARALKEALNSRGDL